MDDLENKNILNFVNSVKRSTKQTNVCQKRKRPLILGNRKRTYLHIRRGQNKMILTRYVKAYAHAIVY